MANEASLGNAVGRFVGGLIRGRFESGARGERERRAQAILEQLMTQQPSGIPAEGGAESDESAIGRILSSLDPATLGRRSVGEPSGIEVTDPRSALLRLGTIFPTGSEDFERFAGEIEEFRTRRGAEQIGPTIADAFKSAGLDVDPEVLTPENIAILSQVMRALPRQGQQAQGFLVDPETGAVFFGTEELFRASQERAAGRETGKRIAAAQSARESFEGFVATAENFLETVEQAEAEGVPVGSLGRALSTARSLAIQMSQTLGLVVDDAGTRKTIQELLQTFEPDSFEALAQINAKDHVLALSLAFLRAGILNDNNEVSREEMNRSLESIAPAFSGDPSQRRAAMQQIVRNAMDVFNARAGLLEGVEPIDPEMLPPRVGALLSAPREIDPEDIERAREEGRVLQFPELFPTASEEPE